MWSVILNIDFITYKQVKERKSQMVTYAVNGFDTNGNIICFIDTKWNVICFNYNLHAFKCIYKTELGAGN